MKRVPKYRLIAVPVLLALLLGACATPTPEVIREEVPVVETVIVEVEVEVEKEVPQEEGPSGQLTISETSDINTVDPKFMKGRHGQNVLRLMFDSLYHRDDNMQIIPWLATSLENPDELTWRFH
ncbi:MAG: hypothetical protein KAJ17_06525, partial [Candidatus Krumholzibacteria bacterium]|nr:hypothetical protein [Candidatus Krumholzibacteria bacterium]